MTKTLRFSYKKQQQKILYGVGQLVSVLKSDSECFKINSFSISFKIEMKIKANLIYFEI